MDVGIMGLALAGSQADVGVRLGVMGRWEAGRRPVSRRLRALCR